ncbi:hypothetical protein Tco_1204082 [Tanacetum coccineum]
MSRRLLDSFQDKYEHVGPKHKMIQGCSRKKVSVLKRRLKHRQPLSRSSTIRKDLKISELETKSKDNHKGSISKITMHEGMKPLLQSSRLRLKSLKTMKINDLTFEEPNDFTSGEIVSLKILSQTMEAKSPIKAKPDPTTRELGVPLRYPAFVLALLTICISIDVCMRTRSQARNRNCRQQQITPVIVEEPEFPMADNRTMAQMLQAPTEGYEDAIVIPEINANFELKHGLINLVQNKQFFGHDKEDPHAHIHSLNYAAGGNFLGKMPRECLRIIESKSKVRNLRNKAVVAKVSSNSSTQHSPGTSSTVDRPLFPLEWMFMLSTTQLEALAALWTLAKSFTSFYLQSNVGFEALLPTRMTLELANRSITHPMGIAEDVEVRVDGFTFLVDFVMVNFEQTQESRLHPGKFLPNFEGYFDSEENVHANQSSNIESLPVSPIPVEDSEPVQEEIDIFLVPDDLLHRLSIIYSSVAVQKPLHLPDEGGDAMRRKSFMGTGEIDNSRIKEQEGMVKNVTSRHPIGQEKQGMTRG